MSAAYPASRRHLALAAALAVALMSGCVSIRRVPPGPKSYAFDKPETTRLGLALAEGERAHPGQSGFAILEFGLEALVARAALADSADHAIDVQYYIYDSDEAGSIMADHLLAAADRGVRVRLLLDDYNLASDAELAALNAHPNIEVRVFNPASCRPRWARFVEYGLYMREAERRMHNKLFIVDNEVTILGGRNVGNEYFSIRTGSAFRDFDILIAGPATRQASSAFDEYWNCPWSVPASALVLRTPTEKDLVALRQRIKERIRNAEHFEEQFAAGRDRYLADLEHDGRTLIWARGEIVSDPPRKIATTAPETRPVARRLAQEWDRANREILIEAAYFLPGNEGLGKFHSLHERGVNTRLLTSAMETTDVPLVFCEFRKWRRDLLAAGVDLYEYKVHSAQEPRGRKWYHRRPSYGALHSKVIVFDRERAWIGSFNLDPRSTELNTEVAVVVENRELAAELAGCITEDMSPYRSWRVQFAREENGSGKKEPDPKTARIVWAGELGGEPVTLKHEPMNLGKRLKIFFLSLIPVSQDQL